MKYFDDFAVGETVVVGEHLLTQEALIEFAQKWDPQFFHVSPEAAEKSIFSGLIAAGTHLMSIAVLLLVKQQPSVAVLAGLGWDEVRFIAPARPGDTLVTSRECLETRPSASKQDRGIVINRITLNNQKGELLLTYVDTILVKKSP